VDAAAKLKLTIQQGCYIGVTGPSYETPAEYKYFRKIGGDAVGMSTVPEVIVAHQMGVRCFGMSVITDLGVPGKIEYLTHEMVKTAAEKAEPKLAAIFKQIISFC
jgi:purine-nucleoside phosphorylase